MQRDLLSTWRDSFDNCVQQPEAAERLKTASLQSDLKTWTSESTAAVVRSCEAIGWVAAAKGSRCRRLPKVGQEFLGMDVMAFPSDAVSSPRWPLPLAVFELENSGSDDRVAYSLWKVLCMQAQLRVVFAYRPDWDQGRALVMSACDDVIGALRPEQRSAIDADVVMVVGSRGEGETFPWGYFKFWSLSQTLGRFEKI